MSAWIRFPFRPEVAAQIGVQWWLDDHVGPGPLEWKDEGGSTWVRQHEYRPDHNGECLTCDEGPDAHKP